MNVSYSLNKFMVRGLDYYCRTTFEFITTDLGAQAAVGAGGRYDGLIESLGGPKKSPGIGFAMGMERLVLLLQQKATSGLFAGGEQVLISLSPALARRQSGRVLVWHMTCACKRFTVAMDHEGRSLKSQMKQADKAGARFVLIIGDAELESGKGMLRNMATEEQTRKVWTCQGRNRRANTASA